MKTFKQTLKESKGDPVADKFKQQYKNSKMSYKLGESSIDFDINPKVKSL